MKAYAIGRVPTGDAPLPPENVLINGARYPSTISGEYTISWAPNPREHFHGPAVSGPETYTLRLYGETDTLIRTVTGLTSTSYTWTDEIADSGLLAGGSSNQDPFDADSISQYTQYSNGTWVISGGQLVATGGTNALLIRNGTSYSNVAIEADINFAHDGGLVLRFIDSSNYYLCSLSDDNGAAPSSNLTIRKIVSGTGTNIGSVGNIVWPRGTSKNIRFTASGTTFTVSVDGVEVASATDSEIAGPGGVGMRNNVASAESKYQAFRWNIQATPRLNTSVRAELEAVRGGVTSYQKQNVKVVRV